MSFIPIENLDFKIAQITITNQDFYHISNPRMLFSSVACDEVGIVSLSADSRSFTLAANKDYFLIATLNGNLFGSAGVNQILMGFYDDSANTFFTYQSVSRLIGAHSELRGHCSSSIEMMNLQSTSSLTVSIRALPSSDGLTFRTYYSGDTLPASCITIMYKDSP